jgi:hypothetical protein
MRTINTHTETVAHLRKLVSKEGIKARVRKLVASTSGIQVFPTAYGIEFTEAEQRFIRNVAKINGLTLVRGMEIDVERMTDPHGMTFHIPAAKAARSAELARQFPNANLRQDVQARAI